MLSSRHEVSGTPYSSTLPPPVMDTLVTDMEWSGWSGVSVLRSGGGGSLMRVVESN
jgi:hypothetical protein